MKDNKSSISGIDANIIVLIGYLGGLFLTWIININYFAWILPLIIYIIEKKCEYVKDQMTQTTILYILVSIITLIFNLIWIIMFPTSYNIGLNLNNFSGSTLVVSTMNILSVTITILITLVVVIASMKTWYYENYKMPVIGFFVPSFRNLLDKIISNKKNDNKEIHLEEEIQDSEKEKNDDIEESEEVTKEIPIKKKVTNKKRKKKN